MRGTVPDTREEPRAGACWAELNWFDRDLHKDRRIKVPAIDTGHSLLIYLDDGEVFILPRWLMVP